MKFTRKPFWKKAYLQIPKTILLKENQNGNV